MLNHVLMYGITTLAAILLSIFNVVTISVLLHSPVHRCKPSTYPILSILTACLVQGITAAPLFIFKEMGRGSDIVPRWVCMVQRPSYLLAHHAIKWSLLAVSVDRFVAVRYPYKYFRYFKRNRVVNFLVALWLVTVVVDSVPFYNGHNPGDKCLYSPHIIWSLTTITIYNIIPFVLMVACYTLIWKVAASMELNDRKIGQDLPLSLIALENDTSEAKQSERKMRLLHFTERVRSSIRRTKVVRKGGRQESLSVSTTLMKTQARKSRRMFLLELKATKTALRLVVVYVCCWGPLGIFYAADQFCAKCLSSGGSQRYTRVAIKALCFSSSIIVPVVYCWFSADYKMAAKRLYENARIWLRR